MTDEERRDDTRARIWITHSPLCGCYNLLDGTIALSGEPCDCGYEGRVRGVVDTLAAVRAEGQGEGRAEVRNVCPGCGEPWRGEGMTMKPAGGEMYGERHGFWWHAACVEAAERADEARAEGVQEGLRKAAECIKNRIMRREDATYADAKAIEALAEKGTP